MLGHMLLTSYLLFLTYAASAQTEKHFQVDTLSRQTTSKVTGLRVLAAGKVWKNGPMLKEGLRFCPKSWNEKGITIQCLTSGSANYATFFVNGKSVRTENTRPFLLGSQSNGVMNSWRPPYYGIMTIGCETQSKKRVEYKVDLTCPWKPNPSSSSQSKSPRSVTPKPKPAPASPLQGKPKKHYCVNIGAKAYKNVVGGLGPHAWQQTSTGMVFKQKFSGRRTFKATAWMNYNFQVPARAHYAIVLEMTTRHGTEHNDVWVKFPNGKGIRLRKWAETRVRGTGWIKAYHNKNGRAKQAFSVDHRPHSMSSAEVLFPGKTYSIQIGGRSSKVILHRIIMFPCGGTTCHAGAGHWNQYLNTC